MRSDAIYCSTRCRVAAHRHPIPAELRNLNRWIRYSKKKIPLTPTNKIASSTHPHTWSDFRWASSSRAGRGLGFVFNGDGIIGIDLDNAFDEWGKLKEWASKLIATLPSTYMEVSPSGHGLHIIGKGLVLAGRRWKFADGGIEIYGTGRFFTMTGKRFKATPLRLNKLGTIVDVLEPIANSMA